MICLSIEFLSDSFEIFVVKRTIYREIIEDFYSSNSFLFKKMILVKKWQVKIFLNDKNVSFYFDSINNRFSFFL